MKGRIVKTYAVGLMWALGLLLAGSDNVYMPWPNLLGIAMFGLAGGLMNSKRLKFERFFSRPILKTCELKNSVKTVWVISYVNIAAVLNRKSSGPS
ncbi:MAG: hypothetical protein JW786_13480 [Desulfobacterales bacterium]|nr:hypothetical protein [Desulfobacterales bacterium]